MTNNIEIQYKKLLNELSLLENSDYLPEGIKAIKIRNRGAIRIQSILESNNDNIEIEEIF